MNNGSSLTYRLYHLPKRRKWRHKETDGCKNEIYASKVAPLICCNEHRNTGSSKILLNRTSFQERNIFFYTHHEGLHIFKAISTICWPELSRMCLVTHIAFVPKVKNFLSRRLPATRRKITQSAVTFNTLLEEDMFLLFFKKMHESKLKFCQNLKTQHRFQ